MRDTTGGHATMAKKKQKGMDTAQAAKVLGCKPAMVIFRLKALGKTDVCGRCGGTGNYSFNMMHGTMCYGCSGAGQVLPVLTEALVAEVKAAQDAGDLDAYFAENKAARMARIAGDRIMKAWQATTVAPLYSLNWRNLDRFPGLKEANGIMCSAYDRINKAAGDYRQKTITAVELEALIQQALAEIKAADELYNLGVGG